MCDDTFTVLRTSARDHPTMISPIAIIEEQHPIVWDTRKLTDPWKMALGLIAANIIQRESSCFKKDIVRVM